MGKLVFDLLALIFSIQLIRLPGVKKLPWFFAGILFFSPVAPIIETPNMSFPRLMIYVLLLTTFIGQKNWTGTFKKFPLRIPLILLFILFLCIGLFDTRLGIFLQIYRPISYFLENFFVIFITYYYIRSVNDAIQIYDFLVKIFFLFAVYGLLNYVTKQNQYNALISNAYGIEDFADNYMTNGISRSRISSFTWHPIFYGFLIDMILILQIFMFTAVEKFKKNIFHFIVFGLLFINLLMVNSRTPLYSLLLGVFVYILFAVNFTKKVVILIAFITLIPIALFVAPDSMKIIDKSVAVVTGQQKEREDGSSVEMRAAQLNASLRIFDQSPIVGNGFQYITEGLHFGNSKSKTAYQSTLGGFESYIYKLLIEQGLFGIFGNLVFFVTLIIWLLKKYSRVDALGSKVIIFSIGLTICFILFIVGTGDLGSFLFFMALMGINIRLVTLCDKSRIVTLDLTELNNYYKR